MIVERGLRGAVRSANASGAARNECPPAGKFLVKIEVAGHEIPFGKEMSSRNHMRSEAQHGRHCWRRPRSRMRTPHPILLAPGYAPRAPDYWSQGRPRDSRAPRISRLPAHIRCANPARCVISYPLPRPLRDSEFPLWSVPGCTPGLRLCLRRIPEPGRRPGCRPSAARPSRQSPLPNR